jgi:hypothetical protein
MHDAKEGGKKLWKQHPQWVTVAADYNGSNIEIACSSIMKHVVTAASRGKCQSWLPTYHFERLLNKTCLNHTYPIKHKLKDCNMMNNFMILGSLTRGMELDEDSGESDIMPFPKEDAVMMVYNGCPH